MGRLRQIKAALRNLNPPSCFYNGNGQAARSEHYIGRTRLMNPGNWQIKRGDSSQGSSQGGVLLPFSFPPNLSWF